MSTNANTNLGEKPISSATTQQHEFSHDLGEKAGYDKGAAIDAENIEHEMSVMQAVKAYPAASWWALVMSSTIVSSTPNTRDCSSDDVIRSWSHIASS